MLKYTSYTVVFQEVPDEVSLAFEVSGCPFKCEGCHSPHLWEDVGAHCWHHWQMLSNSMRPISPVCALWVAHRISTSCVKRCKLRRLIT